MNRRHFLVLALASLVVLGSALPAAALAKVTRLEVSPSERAGDATTRLPAGSTAVFVLFDYDGASNEKLTVSLQGLGLASILAKTDTYNGSGSAAVELTGAEVYRSLVGQLSTYAIEAQTYVKRAADQELGRRGFLEQVQSQVATIDRMLLVLEQMAVPDDAIEDRKATRTALDELAALAEEATAPELEDADRKAKAEEMAAPAEALVTSADAFVDTAEDAGDMPLPETGENAPFTAQVRVGGNPSMSVEFWVVENPQSALTDIDPTKDAGGSGGNTSGRPTARPQATSAQRTTGQTGDGGTGASATTTDRTTSQNPGSTTGGLPTLPSRAMATPVPGATNGPQTGGFVAGEQLGQPTTDASSGAPDQGGAEQAAAPLPTWTVPAVAALGDSQAPQVQPLGAQASQPAGGSTGPNLAILALGAVALIGLAVWMRQRV